MRGHIGHLGQSRAHRATGHLGRAQSSDGSSNPNEKSESYKGLRVKLPTLHLFQVRQMLVSNISDHILKSSEWPTGWVLWPMAQLSSP